MNNVGLAEGVAATAEKYVETAAKWAEDLGRLGELRQTLRGKMAASPLMDAKLLCAGRGEGVYGNGWPAMTVDELLVEARQHHHAGQIEEAEALYRRVNAMEPDHPDALQGLGLLAHITGRHEEAMTLLHKAVAKVPKDARYRLNLSTVLDAMGRTEAAIVGYRQALQLRPKYVGAMSNLADALCGEG